MSTIKTAISIKEPLFIKLDHLAHELNLSRSRLLSIALEEYIVRYENAKLLEMLNDVYGDDNQVEETELAVRHGNHYRNLIEGSW